MRIKRKKTIEPLAKKSSHVRFTENELLQLEADERARGLSIPVLLKQAYFEGRPTAVLMTQDDQKAVLTELIRQGNNLNQLARHVNAGIIGNVKQELENLSRVMTGLMALLSGKMLRSGQSN